MEKESKDKELSKSSQSQQTPEEIEFEKDLAEEKRIAEEKKAADELATQNKQTKKSIGNQILDIEGNPIRPEDANLVHVRVQKKGRNPNSGKIQSVPFVTTYNIAEWRNNILPNWTNLGHAGFTAEADPDYADNLSKVLYNPKA